eukprot:6235131-Amphidinium_carterae.1
MNAFYIGCKVHLSGTYREADMCFDGSVTKFRALRMSSCGPENGVSLWWNMMMFYRAVNIFPQYLL